MAIPVLKLNLAPPPTLWRAQHTLIGWSVLGLGILALVATAGLTWRAYHQADQMGRSAILLSKQTQDSLARQEKLQSQLRAINVQKELPRWKLAERILGERSSPWSRMTAELERSLVQDVRIRSLQRQRGTDLLVVAKVKGEARSRDAEAAFVESLQKNPYFAQVILERESERQGGGVEFEYTLPLSPTPPSYEPLPKYGPARTATPAPAAKPVPAPVVKPAQPAGSTLKPAPTPQASLPTPPPLLPGRRPIRPAGETPSMEASPAMPRPTREVRR